MRLDVTTQSTGYSPMQFVEDTASTFIGLADSFTFGGYGKLVEGIGLGEVNHTPAYNAGLVGGGS